MTEKLITNVLYGVQLVPHQLRNRAKGINDASRLYASEIADAETQRALQPRIPSE